MQFYDLFKTIINYIPDAFSPVRAFMWEAMPYVLMGCALFTSFFGLKCAGIWCGLTFFWMGGTLAARFLLPAFNMYDFWFWTMFGVCIAIAVLCAYFSKYLFRAQLMISSFLLVYSSLPAFVWYLGERGAVAVSLIVAAAIAFLTVRYKYLLVIITTSFSGSFIFWEVVSDRYGVPYEKLWAVLMGFVALAFQCYICREQLKETYKDVKEKYKKTEKGSKKAYRYLDDKVHIKEFLDDEADKIAHESEDECETEEISESDEGEIS